MLGAWRANLQVDSLDTPGRTAEVGGGNIRFALGLSRTLARVSSNELSIEWPIGRALREFLVGVGGAYPSSEA